MDLSLFPGPDRIAFPPEESGRSVWPKMSTVLAMKCRKDFVSSEISLRTWCCIKQLAPVTPACTKHRVAHAELVS